MTGSLRSRVCHVTLLLAVTLYGSHAVSYFVLTHEELIGLAWNESIRPFLLARFPGATEGQLREAHAYAYGGSAIQDMGYYPFGKKLFLSVIRKLSIPPQPSNSPIWSASTDAR